MSGSAEVPRVLLAYLPGWQVRTARVEAGPGPLAVVSGGVVVACCAGAAAEGIVPGLRVRDAQLRCPGAILVERDERVEAEAFEEAADVIERVVPEVHVPRPGVAAVRVRGPARFYGGELAAARAVWQALRDGGFGEARIGVADGMFAAEQAARGARPVSIVSAGRSAEYLSEKEADLLGDERLVRTLHQLGLRTLGQFAALPARDVTARFGEAGRVAHLRARGQDWSALEPRSRRRGHGAGVNFDEPLWLASQVVEGSRPVVEQLVAEIAAAGGVCTQACIMVRTGLGVTERTWSHPWQFSVQELLARLEWQLQDLAVTEAGEPDGVLAVQFLPTVHPAAEHAEGLFGDRPGEHLMHVLTQLQGRDGRSAVLVPALRGDRVVGQRCVLTPFGVAQPGPRDRRRDQPWPGRPAGPAPGIVFPRPRRVGLRDSSGAPLTVADGVLAAEPAWLETPSGRSAVTAWAGPWPVRQRWWGERPVSLERLQLVTSAQQAWLVAAAGGHWWAEACYG
ncbi:MAG: DNA polymerase Y family protein [Propionibacteriaceae bacterium]|nr:DNA polymerase Y family protein [Propionibacteriaceae bacterium]